MNYKEMACHTWALSANPATAAEIHAKYQDFSTMFAEKYSFGTDLKGKEIGAVRLEAMYFLSGLCEKRKHYLHNDIYLCGGFRNGQVCPEHLWLEDLTAGITYDTFIDTDIIMVDRVGRPHQPFQPGCEGTPFGANEIARISMKGLTEHQVASIT